MKFLADVNIPQSVIKALESAGHHVLDIKKRNLKLKDIEIIDIAKKGNLIILTRDKDFIALTQYPKYQTSIIVIRLKNQKPQLIKEHIIQLLNNQDENILAMSITIINEESARSYPYEL